MNQTARQSIGSGRYLLKREVASGGMGRIWEGWDTGLERTVAIKEVALDLLPPAQRPEFLARAEHEGRNAAALADHPNIVAVYDVVIESGTPWTVMQFVRGRSLAKVLEAGPLPVNAVAGIAEQMLSALAHAHENRIVHRDVKPLNIMIDDRDGRALLADFGIAKKSGATDLTQSGMIIGSAAYMAPERHEGEPGGSPSDLFSLGATLFQAVEGYSPFDKGSRTGTITAILVKPLPPMRLAGRLEPLILALTDKNPARRPTVAEARALLGRTTGQQRIKPAGSTLWDPRPNLSTSVAVIPEWHMSGTIALAGHTKTVTDVAFSPDGRVVASCGLDKTVRLWDVATGAPTATWTGSGIMLTVAFSPDGRTLATVGAPKSVYLWDVAAGKLAATLRIDDCIFIPGSVAFSSDGRTLACTGGRESALPDLWVWDVETRVLTAKLRTDTGRSSSLVFNPTDGRRLATSTRWMSEKSNLRHLGAPRQKHRRDPPVGPRNQGGSRHFRRARERNLHRPRRLQLGGVQPRRQDHGRSRRQISHLMGRGIRSRNRQSHLA